MADPNCTVPKTVVADGTEELKNERGQVRPMAQVGLVGRNRGEIIAMCTRDMLHVAFLVYSLAVFVGGEISA